MKRVKNISKFNSPGEAIKELLSQRDWTQEELSGVISKSLKHINEIIQNKRPISQEFANLFASSFYSKNGVKISSSDDWLKLSFKFHSNTYDIIDDPVKRRADIYKYIPVNELIKKGWVKKTSDIESLESQLKKFLNQPADQKLDLTVLDRAAESMHFRKSDVHGPSSNYSALIWKHKAISHVSKNKSNDYDEDGFLTLTKNASFYTTKDNGIKLFLKDLEDVGVRFVFLPHLQKTYLDGAAFSHKGTPIIGLTGRYDRLDNFWFTILHECHHVLKDLNLKIPESEEDYFDDNNGDPKNQDKEKAANKFASNILLEKEILEYFSEDIHYMSEGKINLFAEFKGIHPSIVVGILAHKRMIPYSRLHRYKETVRNKIPKKYCA